MTRSKPSVNVFQAFIERALADAVFGEIQPVVDAAKDELERRIRANLRDLTTRVSQQIAEDGMDTFVLQIKAPHYFKPDEDQ